MAEDQNPRLSQVERIASEAQLSAGRIESRLHEWQEIQRKQLALMNNHLAWYACAIVGLLTYIAVKLS